MNKEKITYEKLFDILRKENDGSIVDININDVRDYFLGLYSEKMQNISLKDIDTRRSRIRNVARMVLKLIYNRKKYLDNLEKIVLLDLKEKYSKE